MALSLRLVVAKALRRMGKLDEAETHFKVLAGGAQQPSRNPTVIEPAGWNGRPLPVAAACSHCTWLVQLPLPPFLNLKPQPRLPQAG